MLGSRSPTNSWSATAWTTRRSTATWPTCASCRESSTVLREHPTEEGTGNAAAIIQTMSSVLSKPDRLPVESLLLDVADVLATSLDLDTTVRRVAEVVRKVIDYEIFAILLLNEKTQELRFRFQVGYPAEFTERSRIKVGEGVTGQAAQSRQAGLVDDATKDPRYIQAGPHRPPRPSVPPTHQHPVVR